MKTTFVAPHAPKVKNRFERKEDLAGLRAESPPLCWLNQPLKFDPTDLEIANVIRLSEWLAPAALVQLAPGKYELGGTQTLTGNSAILDDPATPTGATRFYRVLWTR